MTIKQSDCISHPGVPYTQHISCALKYHQGMHSIGYDDVITDIIKLHDTGKLSQLFQDRMRALERGEKQHRQKADSHAVLSTIIILAKLLHFNGGYDSWSEEDVLKAYTVMSVVRAHHGRLLSPTEFKGRLIQYAQEKRNILVEGLNSLVPSKSDLFKKLIQLRTDLSNGNYKWLVRFPYCQVTARDTATLQLLLSRLVDTDRLSAARNSTFNKRDIERLCWPPVVQEYRSHLKKNSPGTMALDKIRSSLNLERWKHCPPPGVYSMVLPTAAGKTIASLQIMEWWKREGSRAVMVVPFLAISDQTENVIRNLFRENYSENGPYTCPEAAPGGRLITVHHHLAPSHYEMGNDEDESQIGEWVLTERWPGEVTITTIVQFFETLMCRKASKLRKLHMTYGGTIIIDEPQTIPFGLWVSFRKLLPVWAEIFKWRVVLLSATPPYLPENTVPLFFLPDEVNQCLNRTRLKLYPEQETTEAWYRIASRLTVGSLSILWLVNTVSKAEELYDIAKNHIIEGYMVELLTANMCPLHRQVVYWRIRKAMKENNPLLVISTQVLEAGVDLDFVDVVRELAPLPSCIQVAGRKNRRGERALSTVHIIPFTSTRQKQVYTETELDITVSIFQEKGGVIPEKQYLTLSNLFFENCSHNLPEIKDDWADIYSNLDDKMDGFHMIKKSDSKERVIVTADIPESRSDLEEIWHMLTGVKYIAPEDVLKMWVHAINSNNYIDIGKVKQYLALYSVNASKKRLAGRVRDICNSKGNLIGVELFSGYGKTGVQKPVDP